MYPNEIHFILGSRAIKIKQKIAPSSWRTLKTSACIHFFNSPGYSRDKVKQYVEVTALTYTRDQLPALLAFVTHSGKFAT